MNRFSPQEQLLLCVVMTLLLAAWALQAFRAAHPAIQATAGSVQH